MIQLSTKRWGSSNPSVLKTLSVLYSLFFAPLRAVQTIRLVVAAFFLCFLFEANNGNDQPQPYKYVWDYSYGSTKEDAPKGFYM